MYACVQRKLLCAMSILITRYTLHSSTSEKLPITYLSIIVTYLSSLSIIIITYSSYDRSLLQLINSSGGLGQLHFERTCDC